MPKINKIFGETFFGKGDIKIYGVLKQWHGFYNLY